MVCKFLRWSTVTQWKLIKFELLITLIHTTHWKVKWKPHRVYYQPVLRIKYIAGKLPCPFKPDGFEFTHSFHRKMTNATRFAHICIWQRQRPRLYVIINPGATVQSRTHVFHQPADALLACNFQSKKPLVKRARFKINHRSSICVGPTKQEIEQSSNTLNA